MTAKKQTSFSEAFEELESVTQWFEQGEVDLEEALKKFERGLELVKMLQGYLKTVENKVVQIKKQFGKTLADDKEESTDEEKNKSSGTLF